MKKIDETCLFCRDNFIEQNIYENEYFYLVIDQNPVNPGHLLIIPKRHIQTYFELTREEFGHLQEMVLKAKELCHSDQVLAFYQKTVKTTENEITRQWCQLAIDNWGKEITGYNLGSNNGLSAGQTIFHLHIHLIPRFDGDIDDPTGGVRFIIPERANYRRA